MHLVPKPIWSLDLRSPTSCPPRQTIPIKLIPVDKWYPSNSVSMDKWSPKLVPMDKWSPKIWSLFFQIPTACHPGQMEYSRNHLSRGTKLVGNYLSMGTKFLGIIGPWGLNWLSRGTNQLGTNFWGQNVRGLYVFGTKCVTAPNTWQCSFARHIIAVKIDMVVKNMLEGWNFIVLWHYRMTEEN